MHPMIVYNRENRFTKILIYVNTIWGCDKPKTKYYLILVKYMNSKPEQRWTIVHHFFNRKNSIFASLNSLNVCFLISFQIYNFSKAQLLIGNKFDHWGRKNQLTIVYTDVLTIILAWSNKGIVYSIWRSSRSPLFYPCIEVTVPTINVVNWHRSKTMCNTCVWNRD